MRLLLSGLRLGRRQLLTGMTAAAAVAMSRRRGLAFSSEPATLAGNYEDRAQQDIPFGTHSFFRAPWRAYMDTWGQRRFLEVPGINFNVEEEAAFEPVAALLAEAGIRSVRWEQGWGTVDYAAPDRIASAYRPRFDAAMAALRAHGIRPLILLNAHHGFPCPALDVQVQLLAPAATGERAIAADATALIVPHKTGLAGFDRMAYPLVSDVDAATGTLTLSAPLPGPLAAGSLTLWTLRYAPFSGPTFASGTPNPLAQETVNGWLLYVRAVTRAALEALGTAGADDAGFDLEVWNEYTFGSDFLKEKYYYNPPRDFSDHLTYSNHGLTFESPEEPHEIILPMTVDFVNDPANRLPGVNVISGFSNQRPWEHGAAMWPGQAGFSRHYYTGLGNPPLPADYRANQRSVGARGAAPEHVTLLPTTAIEPGSRPLDSDPLDTLAGGRAPTAAGFDYQVVGNLVVGETLKVAAVVQESDDGASGWHDVPGAVSIEAYYGSFDVWPSVTLPTTQRRRYLRLRLTPTFSAGATGTATLFVRAMTGFVPHGLHRNLPEQWHFAYQTEFVARDIQPFPGPWEEHHRFSLREGFPGLARPPQVWMSECGTFRWPWVEKLIAETGATEDDPQLVRLSHRIGAKCLLRTFVFGAHKGLHRLCVYAVGGGEHAHAHVPEVFFTLLKARGYALDEEVRAAFGEQMRVIKRVSDLMRGGEEIESARRLTVDRLLEHDPRLVFRGDGTPAHPDRWNRDDFAVLPFQLAADRYAIGYYVVTRDAAAVHDESHEPLDPARYAMPEKMFDLTLGNVRGLGARVAVFDPMTDARTTPEVLEMTASSFTVRLPAVDYPRFLEVREDRPGPLVLHPYLESERRRAVLSFETNVEAAPAVTWGSVPGREGDGERRLSAGAGRHVAQLPPLAPGVGVRITVEHAGLRAWWPQWGHDNEGTSPA